MMRKKYRQFLNKIFLPLLLLATLVWVWDKSEGEQLKILGMAAIFYLLWAIIHHYFDKSLTLGIFLEYLLTAVLALILLMGVLF